MKRALAARYPRHREDYIEGKTAFVQAILIEARRLNPVRLLNC